MTGIIGDRGAAGGAVSRSRRNASDGDEPTVRQTAGAVFQAEFPAARDLRRAAARAAASSSAGLVLDALVSAGRRAP
jgi:hypothetical protein